MSGTGASSASLPCSTSCSAATDVISLTMEATRNTVSRVIAVASPSRRLPNAPSYSSPLSVAAIATTPDTSVALVAARSIASTWDSVLGAGEAGAAARA